VELDDGEVAGAVVADDAGRVRPAVADVDGGDGGGLVDDVVVGEDFDRTT
jgi:hypothetical protein